MTSHGSNAGDEIERLRKAVQEREACINVLQERAFEARASRDQSVPSVSQGIDFTNAQHAATEATIASLGDKIRASQAALATSERLVRARQAELEQKNNEREVLEAQRRSAIEVMMGVVDEAESSLHRVEEKNLTSVQKDVILETALEGINAMAREFLSQADRIPESELERQPTYKELIPRLEITGQGSMGRHEALTETAGAGIPQFKVREDDRESTDAPLPNYQPSVDNVAEFLASEDADEVDILATSPPGVSAFSLGFDAVSRQSPLFDKTLGLLLRCAYDDSEEEDGGEGSEDEGAHLSAEASPVDTSLPTQSRQGAGVWDIWADENIDIEAWKVAGLDAATTAGEKAKAEAEMPRKGKHAVKNRKKKEKKKFWKQQRLEASMQAQAALTQARIGSDAWWWAPD